MARQRIKSPRVEILTKYDKGGYIYEYWLLKNGKTQLLYQHTRIWEDYYHTTVPKGFTIHHLNHNKKDNNIDNLLCLPNQLHTAIFHNVNGINGIRIQMDHKMFLYLKWYFPDNDKKYYVKIV